MSVRRSSAPVSPFARAPRLPPRNVVSDWICLGTCCGCGLGGGEMGGEWPPPPRLPPRNVVSGWICLGTCCGCGLGGGQMGGECRPLPEHALDRQPAAMTVEDVLDQRQAQPRAALRAGFGHIAPR